MINHGGASDALKYSNDDVFSSSNETGATSRMYTNIRVGSNVSVGADVDAGVVATVAEFISDVGSISNVDGISGVTANQKRNNNDIIANTRMVNPKHAINKIKNHSSPLHMKNFNEYFQCYDNTNTLPTEQDLLTSIYWIRKIKSLMVHNTRNVKSW